MRTLVGGALRAVVVIGSAVLSLRTVMWLVHGNDPSSDADADIGIGLVPIAVAALMAAGWAYADARRHTSSELRGWWAVAAELCGVAAALRSMDSVTDVILLGAFAVALVGLPAYVGSLLGRSHRSPVPASAHGQGQLH
ncbi:hypothetical protein [Flexivirga alba]|uniref:Integral membrane protein n=1 Tax=Flexivirga alba TaxID=702742 RepID=A0ABW2AD17_9MICO